MILLVKWAERALHINKLTTLFANVSCTLVNYLTAMHPNAPNFLIIIIILSLMPKQFYSLRGKTCKLMANFISQTSITLTCIHHCYFP
jgi:hypothetical protein